MLTSLARAARDAGVLRQDQPDRYGLTRSFLRAQVDGGRWTRWGDHLVLTQNAPPSRRQVMFMALVDAGWPAALCSHTALELAGLASFAREAGDVHVVIPRGARCAPLPGLRVHESRRLEVEDLVVHGGLPRTATARAALDAAAWQPFPRFACALVAAVVQQRLCTAAALDEALAHVGRIRHKAYLRLAVRDLDGGSTTTGEMDVLRLCRRFGLVRPRRQVNQALARGRTACGLPVNQDGEAARVGRELDAAVVGPLLVRRGVRLGTDRLDEEERERDQSDKGELRWGG